MFSWAPTDSSVCQCLLNFALMLNLIGLKGGCLGQQLSESHLMLQWSAEPLIVFVFLKKRKKAAACGLTMPT